MTPLDPAAVTESVATESEDPSAYVDHVATGPIHVIWLPSITATPETALDS
jgi:hypothetical protein